VVSRSIARYSPSRRYAVFSLIAFAGAAGCAWTASPWGFAQGSQFAEQLSWITAAVLFGITAGLTLLLALRPRIEVCDAHLEIGNRRIFWAEVRRVDRVAVGKGQPWTAPLLLRMKLAGGEDVLVFHTGDMQSCTSLLRHIYRHSRAAILDDLTYNEFWGEAASLIPPAALPRPRLLRSEDEDEVERMFQRLKAGGRLDNAEQAAPDAIGDPRGSDEP